MSTIATGHALSDELRAVEADAPGWHCWLSDEGRVNAVHCLTRAEMGALERRYALGAKGMHAGSGVTLDAPTPALMRHRIAEYEALAARAA